MAYLAVSRDNREIMFNEKPEYDRIEDCWKENDGEEIVWNDYYDFDEFIDIKSNQEDYYDIPENEYDSLLYGYGDLEDNYDE